jgi:pyridoxal phosphate enzyme (YggS family)
LPDPAALGARLQHVRERIANAAGRAGRDSSSIRLVAVSKTFGVDHILAAARAGQLDFGENKVQEAVAKMPSAAGLPIRWHFIGHLQSNKARKAAEHFDTVHSVDSATLLIRLDEGARAAGRELELLVQVDLAGEATKHGAAPEDVAGIMAAGRDLADARIAGLMTIPPAVDDPEAARPFFRRLREIRDELLMQGVDRAMLTELSMGMSHDYEVAVEEGATIVRVGSAIFGARHYV